VAKSILPTNCPRDKSINEPTEIGVIADNRKPMPISPPVKARYIRNPRKQDQIPPRERRCFIVDRIPLVIGLVVDAASTS
jgi:hypothetical protein